MGIETWSSTASNNDSAPPNGAPEGMFASAVNDVLRQIMADVRAWYDDAEWINRGDTATYASGDSFTLTDDQRSIYHPGRRVRAVGGATGTIYGTITAVTYSAPTTTVSMAWDSGQLQNEDLTVSLAILSSSFGEINVDDVVGLGPMALMNYSSDFTTASGSLSLASGSVGTNELSDDSVTAAKLAGDVKFASGTKMIFAQASAPIGWTQDTTWNDRVLRVVDDTGAGAETGGSWTISGLSVTVMGHALTIDEIPAHGHSYTRVVNGPIGGLDTNAGDPRGLETGTTGSAGGGEAHDHDATATAGGDWRPAYVNVIVCTKD